MHAAALINAPGAVSATGASSVGAAGEAASDFAGVLASALGVDAASTVNAPTAAAEAPAAVAASAPADVSVAAMMQAVFALQEPSPASPLATPVKAQAGLSAAPSPFGDVQTAGSTPVATPWGKPGRSASLEVVGAKASVTSEAISRLVDAETGSAASGAPAMKGAGVADL
ncbi:MAG: hypothetical protein KY446_12460, partial [Proteobacteria bacterium]|nr:hypothetical protein [Pseudomonadota bacterium]